MKCTFFGHGDTPWETQTKLESILINLIENHHVNHFYVGNHGNFDAMALKSLKRLKDIYPYIKYTVVLAYLPHKNDFAGIETLYPGALENVPAKYAIDKRNRWMIDICDYIVVYVTRSFGGALKFKSIAEKKGKFVINLADL